MSVGILAPPESEAVPIEFVPWVIEPDDPQQVVAEAMRMFVNGETDAIPVFDGGMAEKKFKIALAANAVDGDRALPALMTDRFRELQKQLIPDFETTAKNASYREIWENFLFLIRNEREDRAHWVGRAACLGQDPSIFHPSRGIGRNAKEETEERIKIAQQICNSCLVEAECLDYGENKGRKQIQKGEIRVFGGKAFKGY
ncbi:MAG TPA: WhiB family transcriptional regulator [Candidatus Saccharimonadales bacterium]|nr:WhiB family transcriptional regulator [Candidatus Saccharimonadales bacterium]